MTRMERSIDRAVRKAMEHTVFADGEEEFDDCHIALFTYRREYEEATTVGFPPETARLRARSAALRVRKDVGR